MSLFIRYQPLGLSGGGGGGGGGTPGGSNGEIQFNNAGSFGGDTSTTDGAGNISVTSLAASGLVSGATMLAASYQVSGTGVATIQMPQGTATAYNFNLPDDAGTLGYLLTSGGGGSTKMSWTNPSTYQPVITIGTLDAQAENANGLALVSNVLSAQSADAAHPGMVNITTQTFAGQKTFSTGLTGTLTGHATLDVATSSLGNLTDVGTDGIVVTGGTGAVVGSVSLAQHVADTTHNGYLSSTDWNTFNGKQATISLGNFDTTPNTKGLSLSGAAISLAAADGTNPGGLSASAQTIGGIKTFSSAPIMSALTISQVVVTDGSKALASLAYATTATATTLAERDANANLSAVNFIEGYATTATAAGTTTLTVSSKFQQYFTGITTQICQLPVTSTLVLGQQYQIVNLSTGVVTINSSGSNSVQSLAANSSATVTCILTSGTTAASWSVVYNSILVGTAQPPTVQKFTSGSGTYTTPTTAAPLYIRVRMVGGGGGGAGSGTTSGTVATDGGDTTFGSSLLTAGKGTHGIRGQVGGVGGTASLGSGPIGTATIGGQGGASGAQSTSPTSSVPGGQGGSSPLFGGGGSGGSQGTGNAGQDGVTNTGGGGGGGIQGGTTNVQGGAGGGSGGFVDAIIASPAATYAYAVGVGGTAGAAGTSGFAGGNGAAGYIEVTEYYSSFVSGAGNYTVDTFTGDNSTTAFVLSVAPGTVNNAQVYISGVYQVKSTYTVSGTTITFSSAPPTGSSNIQVVTGLAVAINTPADGSVTAAKFASGTGATVTQANPGVVLSAGQLLGTNTNDNAASGKVGEYVSSNSSAGTNFFGTGIWGDMGNIALTAGDWDVSLVAALLINSSTTSVVYFGISSTSGNSGSGMVNGDSLTGVLPLSAASNSVVNGTSIPAFRVSLSGSATYYAKALGTYTVGTPQWVYRMSARRVR